MIEFYNTHVLKWLATAEKSIVNIDNFVAYNDTKISWSSGLKRKLKSGKFAEFSEKNVRTSLYRPFTKSCLYFDRMMNEAIYVFPSIFPTSDTEMENQVIWLKVWERVVDFALITNQIPDLLPQAVLNVSLFTPTTKTAQTDERTSPIGR